MEKIGWGGIVKGLVIEVRKCGPTPHLLTISEVGGLELIFVVDLFRYVLRGLQDVKGLTIGYLGVIWHFLIGYTLKGHIS